jgi:hypothetical protein
LRRRLELVLGAFPLHPTFVPLCVGITWFVELQTSLEWGEVWPTLAIGAGVMLALTLLLAVVTKGLHKGGIAATILAFVNFYLPSVLSWAPIGELGRFATLVAFAFAPIPACMWLRRSPKEFRDYTFFLNVLLVVLMAPQLVQALRWEVTVATRRPEAAALFPDLPMAVGANAPDVWHFVFDRYAGAEVLREVYGYDNGPFLRQLEARGFSVAERAAANYQRTAHSMVSTLNLDYLTSLADRSDLRANDWVPLYRALQDHRVARVLVGAGHRYFHLGSWWNPTRRAALADETPNHRDLPQFARLMIARSGFGRLAEVSGLPYADTRADLCRAIHVQLDTLVDLARRPERKYVLAHVLLPHPPYVVNADGACRTGEEERRASRRENYLGQLEYANKRILDVVDAIARGPRPAVVILQADEGPWPERIAGEDADRVSPADIKWNALEEDELREKMKILYALRMPAPETMTLEPYATPVNAYRLVFQRYFGFDLAPLPERNFVFRGSKELYRFDEVTSRLR